MNTISLLLAVVLLSAMIGKHSSPYARVIIGSMYGIFYFAIWRFYLFYANLYEIAEIQRQVVFFGLIVGATLLSLVLVRIKFYFTVAAVSVVLFIISIFTAFWESTPIQNQVAILSGFYKPEQAIVFKKTVNEVQFTQTTGQYSVAIPNTWQMHKDKGPLFPYFSWQDKGQSMLEFRPRCFNKSNTSIPLIVMNIRGSEVPEKQQLKTKCNKQTGLHAYSCQVYQYNNNNQLKRIEYLASYDKSPKGVELDFVLTHDSPAVLTRVKRVIQSLKPIPGKGRGTRCLGLTEWL